MTIQEIAAQLVKLCSAGQFREAIQSLYSPDIVSLEAGAPPGQSREVRGIDAVLAKGDGFMAAHEVHSIEVGGPLVAGAHFAVTFKMDMTLKAQNLRFTMEEIGVYQVAEGKIVSEQFFYSM